MVYSMPYLILKFMYATKKVKNMLFITHVYTCNNNMLWNDSFILLFYINSTYQKIINTVLSKD